jgi:type IV pilus assembly protein PilX
MNHKPCAVFSASAQLPSRQRGVILFIALIFLVVLSLLGVSLYNTTSAEEKMARNYRDVELAGQAAEAALRDAKIRIRGWWVYVESASNLPKPLDNLAFTPECTSGLCAGALQPVDRTKSLTASPSVKIGTCPGSCDGLGGGSDTGSPAVLGLTPAQQPRYLIELLDYRGPEASASDTVPVYAYRITALGRGRLDSTQVLRQELYIANAQSSSS